MEMKFVVSFLKIKCLLFSGGKNSADFRLPNKVYFSKPLAEIYEKQRENK